MKSLDSQFPRFPGFHPSHIFFQETCRGSSGKQATREKAIRWKVEGAIILRVGFMKMSFGDEKLHLKVLEAAAEVFV